jgi:hypothetical protein
MAGLSPSCQTAGSLLATSMPTKPAGIKWQKVVWQIYFKEKCTELLLMSEFGIFINHQSRTLLSKTCHT